MAVAFKLYDLKRVGYISIEDFYDVHQLLIQAKVLGKDISVDDIIENMDPDNVDTVNFNKFIVWLDSVSVFECCWFCS